MAEKCSRCGAPLTPLVSPPFEGRADDAVVRFVNFPARGCGVSDHPRQLAFEDFGPALLHSIMSGSFPFAGRRGLFKKTVTCSGCHASLEGVTVSSRRIASEIRLDSAPPFTIEIEAPSIACPACGREQLSPEPKTVERIVEALTDALDRGGLKE